MQYTGAYKVRGAYYKISTMNEEDRKKGLVTASAGNHAQGVALAAQKKGIKATICMPAGAPLAKVEATKSYGAEVVLVPGVYDDAAAKAVELQQEKGYTFLHPFNDEYVMAGQGTVGLEIMEKLPEADVVGGDLAPIVEGKQVPQVLGAGFALARIVHARLRVQVVLVDLVVEFRNPDTSPTVAFSVASEMPTFDDWSMICRSVYVASPRSCASPMT